MSEPMACSTDQTMRPIKELVKSAFSTISRRYQDRRDPICFLTGYTSLDESTAGIDEGELFAIIGHHGVGKTILATSIAAHIASKYRMTVAIFSLSLSGEDMVMRMLASMARIDVARLNSGNLLDEDWPKLSYAILELSESKIHIDDYQCQSIDDVRTSLATMHASDLAVIVVDGLSSKDRDRSATTTASSKTHWIAELKALAREKLVSIIVTTDFDDDKNGVQPETFAGSDESSDFDDFMREASTVVLLQQPPHPSSKSTRLLTVLKGSPRDPGDSIEMLIDEKYLHLQELIDPPDGASKVNS